MAPLDLYIYFRYCKNNEMKKLLLEIIWLYWEKKISRHRLICTSSVFRIFLGAAYLYKLLLIQQWEEVKVEKSFDTVVSRAPNFHFRSERRNVGRVRVSCWAPKRYIVAGAAAAALVSLPTRRAIVATGWFSWALRAWMAPRADAAGTKPPLMRRRRRQAALHHGTTCCMWVAGSV